MKNLNQTVNWVPDAATYFEIQKLKSFVDFVSNLPLSPEENTQKAADIKLLIENINKPNTLKQWCVCLNIYDFEIMNSNKKTGFYWRRWTVKYEFNTLEILAESKHTAYDLGHFGDDFYYTACIYFDPNITSKRIYLDKQVDKFIEDAMKYKTYITESLKDIEIDIDIWDLKE